MNTLRKGALRGVLVRALEHALQAPSIHNTQPWRWRLTDDAVELYADFSRHLPQTDPDHRDLVISCGAALHHLQAALAGAGTSSTVQRPADLHNSGLLAVVRPLPGPADKVEAALAAAIAVRRTDRRAFQGSPEPAQLRRLMALAHRHGARLSPVQDPEARRELTAVLAEAGVRQRHVPGYPSELTIWTRRYADARDGVPRQARTERSAAPALRTFPRGQLAECSEPNDLTESDPNQQSAAHDTLAVLTTEADTPAHRLRAGEALSAVLLDATVLGLASTPLSQAIEIGHTRELLMRQLPNVFGQPQLVVRLGLPPTTEKVLVTPRRPLSWVIRRPNDSRFLLGDDRDGR